MQKFETVPTPSPLDLLFWHSYKVPHKTNFPWQCKLLCQKVTTTLMIALCHFPAVFNETFFLFFLLIQEREERVFLVGWSWSTCARVAHLKCSFFRCACTFCRWWRRGRNFGWICASTTHHAPKHGHTLPPPHQDWEEKVSPDGRSYFSNRKLRKTQWVDPRYA